VADDSLSPGMGARVWGCADSISLECESQCWRDGGMRPERRVSEASWPSVGLISGAWLECKAVTTAAAGEIRLSGFYRRQWTGAQLRSGRHKFPTTAGKMDQDEADGTTRSKRRRREKDGELRTAWKGAVIDVEDVRCRRRMVACVSRRQDANMLPDASRKPPCSTTTSLARPTFRTGSPSAFVLDWPEALTHRGRQQLIWSFPLAHRRLRRAPCPKSVNPDIVPSPSSGHTKDGSPPPSANGFRHLFCLEVQGRGWNSSARAVSPEPMDPSSTLPGSI
jgi:hypothetical protein